MTEQEVYFIGERELLVKDNTLYYYSETSEKQSHISKDKFLLYSPKERVAYIVLSLLKEASIPLSFVFSKLKELQSKKTLIISECPLVLKTVAKIEKSLSENSTTLPSFLKEGEKVTLIYMGEIPEIVFTTKANHSEAIEELKEIIEAKRRTAEEAGLEFQISTDFENEYAPVTQEVTKRYIIYLTNLEEEYLAQGLDIEYIGKLLKIAKGYLSNFSSPVEKEEKKDKNFNSSKMQGKQNISESKVPIPRRNTRNRNRNKRKK